MTVDEVSRGQATLSNEPQLSGDQGTVEQPAVGQGSTTDQPAVGQGTYADSHEYSSDFHSFQVFNMLGQENAEPSTPRTPETNETVIELSGKPISINRQMSIKMTPLGIPIIRDIIIIETEASFSRILGFVALIAVFCTVIHCVITVCQKMSPKKTDALIRMIVWGAPPVTAIFFKAFFFLGLWIIVNIFLFMYLRSISMKKYDSGDNQMDAGHESYNEKDKTTGFNKSNGEFVPHKSKRFMFLIRKMSRFMITGINGRIETLYTVYSSIFYWSHVLATICIFTLIVSLIFDSFFFLNLAMLVFIYTNYFLVLVQQIVTSSKKDMGQFGVIDERDCGICNKRVSFGQSNFESVPFQRMSQSKQLDSNRGPIQDKRGVSIQDEIENPTQDHNNNISDHNRTTSNNIADKKRSIPTQLKTTDNIDSQNHKNTYGDQNSFSFNAIGSNLNKKAMGRLLFWESLKNKLVKKKITSLGHTLSCNHRYHTNCIRGWYLLSRSEKCPCCMEKFNPENILDSVMKGLFFYSIFMEIIKRAIVYGLFGVILMLLIKARSGGPQSQSI